MNERGGSVRDRSDAIADFEHSHAEINELVLRLGGVLSALDSSMTPEDVPPVTSMLEEIRDELLVHFAREEEGLFPFIRAQFPDTSETVDRLEASHDTICGTLVRLEHLAGKRMERSLAFVVLHERFESAYAEHGRDEKELLRDLAKRLDADQRADLARLVQGL